MGLSVSFIFHPFGKFIPDSVVFPLISAKDITKYWNFELLPFAWSFQPILFTNSFLQAESIGSYHLEWTIQNSLYFNFLWEKNGGLPTSSDSMFSCGLSVSLSVYVPLSNWLPVCQSIYLSAYFYPSIYLPICVLVSIHLSIGLSVYLFTRFYLAISSLVLIYLSAWSLFYRPFSSTASASVHLQTSVYAYIYIFMCTFICLC